MWFCKAASAIPNITRWLLVGIIATLGWSGWRAYAFRSALSQARALGWTVEYTDPAEWIRKDWRSAFNKQTWLDGVIYVGIPRSEALEQHLSIVNRLNPKVLYFADASTLRDLSALKPRSRLQRVTLYSCARLTSLDALKDLPTLHEVILVHCPRLTNVDALKNLSALQKVTLAGCTGLTTENVAALQAAQPKTKIIEP